MVLLLLPLVLFGLGSPQIGIAAAAAAAESPIVATAAARAEPQAPAEPTVATMEVVDQTTFVAADGTFTLELAIDPPPPPGRAAADSSLAITVHGLLGAEAEVDESLTQPLNRLPVRSLGEVPSSGPGRYRLEIPIRSGPQFDELDRVLLPNPGVYPLAIELRSPDGSLASTRTHLVRLPQVTSEDGPVDGPLPVAIVLSVSTTEGLTVDDVRQLLVDHPSIPMTVILQEGVENQLRSDTELAVGFVEALAGRPVLAVPPVDLDPSALAEIDQAELYLSATESARAELTALGLTVAADVAMLDAPITEAGMDVISRLGIRSALDTGTVAPGSGRLETRGRRLQVVRIDQELSRILGGGTDGPHRANRVLARLTMRGLVGDAPVVLGGAELGVDPGPSVDALLRALTQPGAPRPILLSDATAIPTLRLAERPEQDLVPVADELVAVQDKVATYEGFFSGGGNTPRYYRQQILSALTRQRNPTDRRRALELLDSQLDDDLSVIELHDGQPVTLAARSAPIPIIVENNSGGPRQILLRFDSDKVVATEDRQLITVQPGTSALEVQLETRSLGVSPLEVSVWTPDGVRLLADTRYQIRSTAVPGLGLLVSIGAVCLLAAWWVLDVRRRRAAPADGAVPSPEGPEMKPVESSGSV